MALIITVAVMAAIIVLFYGVLLIIGPDDEVEERLASSPRPLRLTSSSTPGNSPQSAVGRRLAEGKLGSKLSLELAQASVQMKPGEFMLMTAGLGVGSFIIGMLISRSVLGGLGLFPLALMAPRFWLKRKKSKRIAAFQNQLPDVLNLVVGSLRAGYGLIQAMQLVAQEMPSPSKDEFERVTHEISLGIPLQDALNRLVERMESEDLGLVVTAITIQNEVGGNLGNILETISATIRDRVRVQGEIRTMTSMQRMTGYMLAAMPFFVAAILMVLNPGYILQMFQFPWIVIPIGAVISMGLGIFFMNALLKIDY